MFSRLQKNHYLMIFLSFFLSLLLLVCVFSISAQPVHAVAVADDVLLALGAICLSLSINFAVNNPDWSSLLQPVYDSLSESSQQLLFRVTTAGYLGYSYVFDYSPAQYAQLTNEIIDYFNSNSFDEVPGTITPSNSNGKIGFTADTSFTLFYPNGTNSVTYYLPSGQLKIFAVATKSDFPNVPAVNNVTQIVNSGYTAVNSDGFGFYYPTYNSVQQNTYDSYWTPYRINDPDQSWLKCNKSNFGVLQLTTSISQYGAAFFMDSFQNVYELKAINGVWGFYNVQNSLLYNNLSFSSSGAARNWFRRSLGFAVSGDSDVPAYTAPVVDTGFDFDEQEALNAQSVNLSNADESGSVSVVTPASSEDLEVLIDNPSAVTDVSEAQQLLTVYTGTQDIVKLGFNSVVNFLSSIANFVSGFFQNLVNLFIPPPEFWNGTFLAPVLVAIENKFTFLAGFQNWLELFANTQGQSLYYQFEFMGRMYSIDFSWYSDYRLIIRSCFSVLFLVCSTLKCLKLLTSAFNVSLVESSSSSSLLGLPEVIS